MTTPQQLLEQLRAAERDASGPPQQTSERIWEQVEARLEHGPGPPELDTSPLIDASNSTGLGLKIAGLVLLLGALGGGAAALGRDRGEAREPTMDVAERSPVEPASRPSPQPLDQPSAAHEPDHEPADRAPAAGTDSHTTLEPEPAVEPPEPANEQPAKEQPANKQPAAPKTLADELALMQSLSTALKQGDSRRARALVREHERDFPSGQFIEERHAAKARALCQSGRVDAGREQARAFAERWPTSIHLATVNSDCGQP